MYVRYQFSEDYASCFHSAKFEVPENDLPPSVPIIISGFPTLKFKPAGTNDFIDYEGDRSFESLVAFVEQHAKNSLEIPSGDEVHQVPLEAGNATHQGSPEFDYSHHDDL